jgi:hypothetical protein
MGKQATVKFKKKCDGKGREGGGGDPAWGGAQAVSIKLFWHRSSNCRQMKLPSQT